MNFEKIKIKDLIFPEYNPRKKLNSEDKEYKKIKNSISEFGYVDPVIVNKDNTIVGGNQRCQVLKDLGFEEIDIVRVDISKDKEKMLNIALNKITGEWDFDKLTELLKEIKIDNEDDLFLTGFEEKEFDKLLKEFDKDESPEDDFDEEKALKEVVEPITNSGVLYQLGKHFLMCSDSTNEEHVKKLLQGVEPILMVTDPPYGVEYDPEWRDQRNLRVGKRSKGKVKNDDIFDWSAAYNLFPGDVAYIWHAALFSHRVAQNIENCGYEIVAQIIWSKQHFALSRGNYNWQHEPLLYCVKKNKKHNWHGGDNATTIWNIKSNNNFGNPKGKEKTYGHGTQKPVECMLRPIENNSSIGQAVYDPFLGSGTTLVAAEKSGRVCYGMEIDPVYCDMIIKRYIELKEGVMDDVFLIENGEKIPWKNICKYEPVKRNDSNEKK